MAEPDEKEPVDNTYIGIRLRLFALSVLGYDMLDATAIRPREYLEWVEKRMRREQSILKWRGAIILGLFGMIGGSFGHSLWELLVQSIKSLTAH